MNLVIKNLFLKVGKTKFKFKSPVGFYILLWNMNQARNKIGLISLHKVIGPLRIIFTKKLLKKINPSWD
jgi:hypothetical protein